MLIATAVHVEPINWRQLLSCVYICSVLVVLLDLFRLVPVRVLESELYVVLVRVV